MPLVGNCSAILFLQRSLWNNSSNLYIWSLRYGSEFHFFANTSALPAYSFALPTAQSCYFRANSEIILSNLTFDFSIYGSEFHFANTSALPDILICLLYSLKLSDTYTGLTCSLSITLMSLTSSLLPVWHFAWKLLFHFTKWYRIIKIHHYTI